MFKKLLIPVLAVTVAALGCTGGSSDTTGGGAGMTGAAGSTAGVDGSTASADGSTASADGSMTGLNSEAAGADVVCNLDTFCPVFLAYCGTANPGYTTLAACMTTFAAVGAADPDKQTCESQHLCLAIYDTGSDRVLHCSHAAGGGGLCGL